MVWWFCSAIALDILSPWLERLDLGRGGSWVLHGPWSRPSHASQYAHCVVACVCAFVHRRGMRIAKKE